MCRALNALLVLYVVMCRQYRFCAGLRVASSAAACSVVCVHPSDLRSCLRRGIVTRGYAPRALIHVCRLGSDT